MADATVVHIGENSPERIAYKLLEDIARVEGRVFHDNPRNGDQKADRAWILDAYAECIKATRGVRPK